MGIVESAYTAAQARLRPILTTVPDMVFGMLPLMFSSGAGANGNVFLATGVISGMAVGTAALLFVTPVFYIVLEYLEEKFIASAVGPLVQPLFKRGQNIANLKITKAQQEEAWLSFEQTLLNA